MPANDDLEVFSPLEFAFLIHEESSMLAKTARDHCIHEGYNIFINTVTIGEERPSPTVCPQTFQRQRSSDHGHDR